MEKKKINLTHETLAYYDEGKSSNKQLTICLIHGNTSSSSFFCPLIEQLSPSFRVVAMDLRGFGDSSYHQRYDSLATLADDVAQLLKALKIKEVLVLGWSLGGGVAMYLALNYPSLVKKLYLLNSTPCGGFPLYKDILADGTLVPYANKEELSNDPVKVIPILQLIESQNAEFFAYIFKNSMYNVNSPSPSYQTMCVQEALKMRCLVDADWALTNLNLSHLDSPYAPATHQISQLKIPTYLTFSAHDLIVTKNIYLTNEQAISADQVKLVYFEHSGHSPIVDELPKLVQSIKDLANQ